MLSNTKNKGGRILSFSESVEVLPLDQLKLILRKLDLATQENHFPKPLFIPDVYKECKKCGTYTWRIDRRTCSCGCTNFKIHDERKRREYF